MALKVLIVEDQFVEAENLSIILKNQGYEIHGIAKSVDQANKLIETGRPDIVLLDIFLKGSLTGIDLAGQLDRRNIPFIFLTANSNAITMEDALVTNPFGFLIKPFREREILMALNIAVYRHQKGSEFLFRQQQWLNQLLRDIIDMSGTKSEKTLALVKALTSFLPFDFIVVDTDVNNQNEDSVYRYQRTGFDEYARFEDNAVSDHCQVKWPELAAMRKKNKDKRTPYYLNGEDYLQDCKPDHVKEHIRQARGFRAKLWVPLLKHRDLDMSIVFYCCTDNCYSSDHINLILSVQDVLAKTIISIRESQSDHPSQRSIQRAKLPGQLLKPELKGIVGNSPKLLEALDKASQVAPFDNTVLITGETGVGKEGLVNALHQLSSRKDKPFVKVNCAAIPINLVESELFGHEKGSFTGSVERRIGKFELANGGTIFLDEIGELPIEIQSKLLRAIQEKEIERIGGRTTIKTDVRIIAATNRSLVQEIANGNFRLDLYYRLNVFPIALPPLRDRKQDIPALVDHFLGNFSKNSGREKMSVGNNAMQQLINYDWPGNIRELHYLVERHALLARGSVITHFEMPEPIPLAITSDYREPGLKSFDEMDREHIISALKKANGKVSGSGGAGELLKLRPTTLRSKMKRLGITWPLR